MRSAMLMSSGAESVRKVNCLAEFALYVHLAFLASFFPHPRPLLLLSYYTRLTNSKFHLSFSRRLLLDARKCSMQLQHFEIIV